MLTVFCFSAKLPSMINNNHLKVLVVFLAAVFLTGCSREKLESVNQDFELSQIKVTQNQNSSDEQTNQQTPPTDNQEPPVIVKKEEKSMKTLTDFAPIEAKGVTIHTNKGDVVIELFRDKTPLTTLNFLSLAKEGFYDGIIFHRVIPNFMAQVGDPLTKTPGNESRWGSGGPGYTIADEFDESLKHDKEGVVSMANAGPNTGGSQIFITYGPQPHLDGKHAVFGQVTTGMDVLKNLSNGDKIVSVDLVE